MAKLLLQDGSIYEGKSYGAEKSIAGEVVFSTGMMGYPESITDPSYKGQILILTYPLIGNYGVPKSIFWESDSIMVSGLIVSNYIDTPSHFQSTQTLATWFKNAGVPLLEIKDTRLLTQKIREHGAMLGKIIYKKDVPFYDPNTENLVAQVSTKKIIIQTPPTTKQKFSTIPDGRFTSGSRYNRDSNNKTILLIDCGAKRNIQRALLKRGVTVITVPWDFDPFDKKFDALIISNGPGDPKLASKTIQTIKKALEKKIPILGICLGHQLLALAAGGNTDKLKYGHRSQNQPCIMQGSKRCYITTQNHGFTVTKFPKGFRPWFTNANDGSNEGMKHARFPFMSVQFHPEAAPGPEDTEWIFDFFLKKIGLHES